MQTALKRLKLGGKNSLIVFLIPITIYMILFFLYPIIYEVYISFFDYDLGSPKEFIGLKNYMMIGSDNQFVRSLGTTALFIFFSVISELILGLCIAILLNKETRAMDFIRTVILIPTVFTPLVAGLVWKALYQPDLGTLSYFLRKIGLDIGRGLTVERSTALLSVIIVDIWEWTPMMVIIILAGLKSLPVEPYEAGRIDGASRWHLFRYITVPLMRPTFTVALLIRTLDGLKVFDIIFAITRGGPGTATTVSNLRIYEVGMQNLEIGYASALSNVLLVIGIVTGILFINILYSKRYGGIR